MAYIQINQLKIYLDRKGSGDKKIIFLHGNSLSSNLFKYQFEDKNLLNSYELIRFDFPVSDNQNLHVIPVFIPFQVLP
jgi:pimeloyl-ACP methyl ester carboxylesterase